MAHGEPKYWPLGWNHPNYPQRHPYFEEPITSGGIPYPPKPRRQEYGVIDLGPTREEVDELKRRVEQLEQGGKPRPQQVLRSEDI